MKGDKRGHRGAHCRAHKLAGGKDTPDVRGNGVCPPRGQGKKKRYRNRNKTRHKRQGQGPMRIWVEIGSLLMQYKCRTTSATQGKISKEMHLCGQPGAGHNSSSCWVAKGLISSLLCFASLCRGIYCVRVFGATEVQYF